MRMMVDEDDAHKNDEDDLKKVSHSSSSSKLSIINIDCGYFSQFCVLLFYNLIYVNKTMLENINIAITMKKCTLCIVL